MYLEPHAERNLELLVVPPCEVRDPNFKPANARVSGYLPWQYVNVVPSNDLPPAAYAHYIGGIKVIVTPYLGSQIRFQENPDGTTSSVIVGGIVAPATNA